jgi:HEAT repeat protein/ATP/ADP translocase
MSDQTEAFWRQLPGVRTLERSRFLFFAGLATIISLAQTLGLTGAEALFLAHYGAAGLPRTFVAAALVTVLGSMVYAARVGVVRNDGLFTRMLGGAAIILVAATAAIATGHLIVLPGLLCFFYLTQAVFVNHLWTFTGDYFDTVASKRLIPLFPIGASVGGFLGGAFASLMTRLVGPESLIAAWAVFLAAGAIMIHRAHSQLLRWGPLEAEEADETSVEGIQAAMRHLGRSPLGRWLSVSAMGMMLSLFLMQYLYSEIFASEFTTAASLAAFLGAYLAITNLVEIGVEVRLMPWLIRKLGVPTANLLHPVLTLLSFGGLAFQFGLTAGVAARVNREMLENSVAGPLRALVYNAMPMRYRGRTRAFLEGIVIYAGMALAGLVLLVFEAPDPLWLCGAGGAMGVIYLAANLRVRREYLRTIVKQLREGRLDLSDIGEEVGVWEAKRLADLWEQMLQDESSAPSNSLLQLVPSLAALGAVEPLMRAISHPHPVVRRSCINALAGAGIDEAKSRLLLALDDEDSSVRLAALRALVHMHESSRPIEPVVRGLLSDPDPAVRAEAARVAGESGEQTLREMLRSESREEALAALRCAPATAHEAILERAGDADPAIRAAALESLAQTAAAPPLDSEALAKIVSDPDARVRRAGVMLLANADDPEWFGALADALGDRSQDVRFAAEKVLGSMGEAGVAAVEPLFQAHFERTVESALRVVDAADIPASREILKRELRRRAHEFWRAVTSFQWLPKGAEPTVAFLRVAYADEVMRTRRIAFRILELLEDPKVVRRVDRALQFGSTRARGDALEVLSHLGDREAAGLLVLIQETGPLADRRAEAAETVSLPNSSAEVAAAALNSESGWIAMAARSIDPSHPSNVHEEKLMERLLALKQVPLFAQLSLEQLEAIQQISREHEYLANETIIKEGDRGGDL